MGRRAAIAASGRRSCAAGGRRLLLCCSACGRRCEGNGAGVVQRVRCRSKCGVCGVLPGLYDTRTRHLLQDLNRPHARRWPQNDLRMCSARMCCAGRCQVNFTAMSHTALSVTSDTSLVVQGGRRYTRDNFSLKTHAACSTERQQQSTALLIKSHVVGGRSGKKGRRCLPRRAAPGALQPPAPAVPTRLRQPASQHTQSSNHHHRKPSAMRLDAHTAATTARTSQGCSYSCSAE